MTSEEEKLEFPPQKAYFIASLVLVNQRDEMLLVKEKRCDVWLTPGGEIDYVEREQFIGGALREAFEEIGITFKEKPELIDLTISYPEGDNPYKDKQISMVIATYISKFPTEQKIKLRPSLDPKERKYDVKKYLWIKPEEIVKKRIKVPRYYITNVIPKISPWLKNNAEE